MNYSAFFALFVLWSQFAFGSIQLGKIKLPPGFAIEVFNNKVPKARSMALSPKGVLFVGTREENGKVYAIKDGKVFTIADGLNMPNGVAFKDGSLFIAEVHRVIRFDGVEDHLSPPPKLQVVYDKLPKDRHHGWKFIRFSPDGWLYLPVGAPCNICEHPENPQYASILRMRPDGSKLEVFASGVRNTVGFDWDPNTKELWFTDNGRDMLGDDKPVDELNHAPKKGLHFGYPYCHQGDIPDPEFGAKKKCSEFAAPALKLAPHVAALGMRFYRGDMFPTEYRNQVFIAEHGSWNRSKPIGYRLSVARMERNRATRYETFAEGWLQGEEPWGRPVDVLEMPDGALLVSDDLNGVIYRISYKN